jgi:hypothetical protein
MIDQTTFKNEWAILCERFGRKYSPVMAARYFRSLSPRMDTDSFVAACSKLFASSEFFPSPDAFVDAVGAGAESSGLDQWELCERVAEGEGGILERMDAAGQRAVRLLGGQDRLRNTPLESLPFVRKEFLSLYRETVQGEPEKLLPEVTPESRAIVGDLMKNARLLTEGEE